MRQLKKAVCQFFPSMQPAVLWRSRSCALDAATLKRMRTTCTTWIPTLFTADADPSEAADLFVVVCFSTSRDCVLQCCALAVELSSAELAHASGLSD